MSAGAPGIGRIHVGYTYINVDPYFPLHLWFVCTWPDREGRVVTLNLTSFDSCVDPTCLIVPGEHPFVTHDSLIEYQRGKLTQLTQIEQALDFALFVPRQVAADALMTKIRQGALVSEFASFGVKAAITNCPWTPPRSHSSAPSSGAANGPGASG